MAPFRRHLHGCTAALHSFAPKSEWPRGRDGGARAAISGISQGRHLSFGSLRSLWNMSGAARRSIEAAILQILLDARGGSGDNNFREQKASRVDTAHQPRRRRSSWKA
ncbi:unnamed protein product [Urochloa humidicola]